MKMNIAKKLLLINKQDYIDSQTQNEKKKEIDKLKETTIKNIYDPSQLKEATIKITNTDFPKDEFSRHFSSSFYI